MSLKKTTYNNNEFLLNVFHKVHKHFPKRFPKFSLIFASFQQWRLIPKLAATYALVYFARTFFMNFVELQVGMMMGESGETQVSY